MLTPRYYHSASCGQAAVKQRTGKQVLLLRGALPSPRAMAKAQPIEAELAAAGCRGGSLASIMVHRPIFFALGQTPY